MKTWMLCWLCITSSVLCLNEDIVNMLLSFVTIDDRPTSVLLFHLCWTSYEIKSLVKSLSKMNVNTATTLQINKTEYFLQQILFITDLSCDGTEKYLLQASEQGYFKSPYRWIMLNFQDVPDLNILIDSDVVFAQKYVSEDYLLVEAYKIAENSDLIYSTRAVWHPRNNPLNIDNNYLNTSLMTIEEKYDVESVENNKVGEVSNVITGIYGVVQDFRENKVLSSRRRNLRRHTLTIALVVTDSNETREHLDDRLQLDKDLLSKMTYAAVTICFEMLNSTEKIKFTPTWGYKDRNGKWQGVIDYLIRKEADLGTITLFSNDRLEVIDYIAMSGSTNGRFVFREPPLAYVANIFTLPFSRSVWLAILICVLGCALFLYVATKWESSISMHPGQLDGTWTDVFILTVGAVLQQGCTQEPRYAAGRVVTLLLFITLTMLYAAYSANIVVLLRASSTSIKTLQNLYDSPLELAASDFEYSRVFFRAMKDPLRKSIFEKRIAPKGKKGNYYSMQEGVERIRKGLFAFHMELNTGYRIIQETYQEIEKCDLVEVDYLNLVGPWVPGQKRAALKELFKINLIKIRETGLQACIKHRLQVPRPRCSGPVTTFNSVGIADMYPAMMATMYGMLMAPVVLIVEIAHKKLTILRNSRKITSEDIESFVSN